MKIFVLILFSLVLYSCQDVETITPPEDLIPETKIVEVLTELSLLNSAKNYNKRFLEETGLKPDEYLYQKYNIDSTQLAESTRYYANNHLQFERIYIRVRENLEKFKKDHEVLALEQQRVADSILSLEREGDSLRINPDVTRNRTQRSRPLDSLVAPPNLNELEQ